MTLFAKDAGDHWQPDQAFGPTEDLEHFEWEPFGGKQTDQADLKGVVVEAGVKFVIKRLLSAAMQRTRRAPVDMYTSVAKEMKDYLKEAYNQGATRNKGKMRTLSRHDVNSIFKSTLPNLGR